MTVIGLWMYRSERCHRYRHPEKILQQILFSEGGGGNRAKSPSENDESQSSRGAGFTLRNRRVADGGWGAAISHLAAGVEWDPDPPPGEARPTT